ncbi:MAG: sensor histidine kinase KdpD [Oscillospiraceae bacterium]
MADRASPEEILKRIKDENLRQNRGHLKIFFGYAAGVGKTYAMLKAAHAAKRRGVDVVAGYIEPHARPQTKQLLNGLEALPTMAVEHKSITLNEFDLDAALKRRPKLILVDELAHTNSEYCRHTKRYQDVEELLNAGIDVFTTINVQHIESLNDIVASITGVIVGERIPDHVFDSADQVELVDIEPEELIERFNSGRVYGEAQTKQALGNFFSTENLTALREIALRRTADRVNRMSERARLFQPADYFTEEHILVCLSSSPSNQKIIRTAARMAKAFSSSFTALFVEDSAFQNMSEENKKRLRGNIHLAQQLGATIETACGDDVAFQIAEFARLSGVSKIVLGRSSLRRKHFWDKAPLTERLIEFAPTIDIYIIPDQQTASYSRQKSQKPHYKLSIADILKSLGILGLATLLGFLFYRLGFSEANIITVYILGVLIIAVVTTNRLYSLVSSVFSVLIFNFFFTVPRFSLQAYDKGYPLTFLVMFIAAFITGSLATQIKKQAKQSAKTANRTKILLETNLLLQEQKEADGIIEVTANQLVKLMKKDIVFYKAENDSLLPPKTFTQAAEAQDVSALTSENEKAVANWVFKNNKHAGATTNTLGNAKCLYLAIRVSGQVLGVVGIALKGSAMDTFENNILLSILGECALALEKEKASRQREEAAALAKNEQLRANLLRSISHDLRTPLTSISGNAAILLSSDQRLSAEKRARLYTDIYDDSLWLINLVENLLSVTRIEDGTMGLHLQAELMDEVISEALAHINRKSAEHKILVRQSEDYIMAKMDARLIVQVIINIVDNAIKYTPQNSTITISVKKRNHLVSLEIADDGNGLSDEEKSKIFEMFYTANSSSADSRRGLGLGLALCKSIITAHGGEISVSDNKPRGTIFTFTLPAEEVRLHE